MHKFLGHKFLGHKFLRRKFILLAGFVLFATPTYADTVAAPDSIETKPQEIASVIKADKPLGQGALKRLWFKGYDASLWTDAHPWSIDSTYALMLRYARDFSRNDLVERSIEEIQKTSPLSDEQKKDDAKQLATVFPDVHENDTITALYQPGKGATFFYNGKKTGQITDTAFAKQFMSIWLGPNTSEPKLRDALLGQKG